MHCVPGTVGKMPALQGANNLADLNHLDAFRPRRVLALPLAARNDWRLKRYAILADDRVFDENVAEAATTEAFRRLPKAGDIFDQSGNHGVGFQIIHFAQIAVVSPVFYWQWGSVLAHIDQLRAPWDNPTVFSNGKPEVTGCVWEMDIVSFEVQAWKETVLSDRAEPDRRLGDYFDRQLR